MRCDPRALFAIAAAAASASLGAHVAVEAFAPSAPPAAAAPPRARAAFVGGSASPAAAAAGALRASPSSSSSSASPGGGGDAAAGSASAEQPVQKAPNLHGKVIFPVKALTAGLGGQSVAAVYAVMNSKYKRGSGEGWEHCEYVGVARDLGASLRSHVEKRGSDSVAHVRALSFAYPQRSAMEEFATRWRDRAAAEGGKAAAVGRGWEADVVDQTADDVSAAEAEKRAFLEEVESAYFDEDDEDEDEGDYDLSQSLGDGPESDKVVSPFSNGGAAPMPAGGIGGGKSLAFSRENVDKVLDEIRPYLISDGGNVAVHSVDEETGNVYLLLEGACGSCASSTVTMQMGIERVLKENFPDLGEVIQVVEDMGGEDEPTELTLEAVEEELNRIKPAIIAMGGVVEIVSVDPLGVVELRYRGSNKLQQGLELAIRDVPFVKHVEFVS